MTRTIEEAAQQALEALEADNSKLWPSEKRTTAITALRAALADPVQEPTRSERMRAAGMTRRPRGWIKDGDEPVQEPVQEHEDWCASVTQLLLCDPPRKAPCNCKKKVAEPVQEPVAVALHTGTKQGIKWHREVEHGTPLYTAPPQRKPLTDEEIHDCWQQKYRDKVTERRLITRAIERAHGIGGSK